jgi:hypothetical protein
VSKIKASYHQCAGISKVNEERDDGGPDIPIAAVFPKNATVATQQRQSENHFLIVRCLKMTSVSCLKKELNNSSFSAKQYDCDVQKTPNFCR